MAKTSPRDKIRVTENQLKVIKDKYLRDAPTVSAWLLGVARNTALGEILVHPKAEAWGVFEGINRLDAQGAILYHQGLPDHDARHANFRRLMSNLEAVCAKVPEAKVLREKWAYEFYGLMSSWDFLPNSPTLMNAGRELQQLSACYVLPVPDSMEGITKSLGAQSMIQKSGGGTGFSFSSLRPKGDLVKKTHGVASGALSFMKLFDTMTEVVKQGGTRRGANMAILRYDHPEILDFIRMKTSPGVMENFNVSVGIDAAFMRAVEADAEYPLVNPRSGKTVGKLRAKEVFDAMVECAWRTGDPGFVVLDRINASGSNTTPALGQIESTNPCFAGHVRVATDRGLLTFEELFLDQTPIAVATDGRVVDIRTAQTGGATTVAVKAATGVILRKAVPVFKTRKNWPVFTLKTEHGYEVTATSDHKFFTPSGLMELKDLKPGDEILIQSGPGVWSQDHALPPFIPADKLKARIARGAARLPKIWSRELGELVGWVIGDGWVSEELPQGRQVPNYTIGLMYGDEEKKILAPKFRALIKGWTGLDGSQIERNGTLTQYYKSALFYFLRSLGVHEKNGLAKEVPESIWKAPHEAVRGFLSALFTADGTVNISVRKGSCSIRLAGSSKNLLRQVQQLLLNEGIVSKLYLRRKAGAKLMPNSKREPKLYQCAAQYELVLDGENRDLFLREIGFLTASKQMKAEAWLTAKKRKSNKDRFTDQVQSIQAAGNTDVYCTTEGETHSIIANGFVTAQCGEQPLLPWEPCNLGSLNLSAFVTGETGAGRWDFPRLKETVGLAVRFLDDVIEVNDYPLPEIEKLAKGNRRVGLGVMGWAEALVKSGTAYADPAALKLADKVMSFINGAALDASEKLAAERGVFPNWKDSVYDPKSKHFRGETHRPRHCARTTIAPTGTIAIAAGLQGGGIEPFFAIAYTRYNAKALELLKNGKQPEDKDVFVEINPLFQEYAEKHKWFGLDQKSLTKLIDENHKSLSGLPEIPDSVQKLFSTAHDVAVETHVRMQAAFQRHVDNGVSKTINLPETATIGDVREAYLLSYRLGCKGITVYRDGSKAQQVLNLSSAPSKGKRRTPEASLGLDAEYYQIRTGYGPLHVHINYDEKGPFQLFTNIPPLGTEIAGLTSLVGILISKYLAEGGDPLRLLKHLNSVKGDRPIGLGTNRVDSIPHALAIALRAHLKKTGWLEGAATADPAPDASPSEHCPKCFSRNVAHESGCTGVTCHDCGHSECS